MISSHKTATNNVKYENRMAIFTNNDLFLGAYLSAYLKKRLNMQPDDFYTCSHTIQLFRIYLHCSLKVSRSLSGLLSLFLDKLTVNKNRLVWYVIMKLVRRSLYLTFRDVRINWGDDNHVIFDLCVYFRY